MAETIYLRIGTEDEISLSVFIESLQNFLHALKDLDAAISRDVRGSLVWNVVRLEKRSPPLVGVAAHQKKSFRTSTFTIVEVIRPKRHGSASMPAWAKRAIELVEKEFPHARNAMEVLWRRYQSNDPSTKLTPDQIDKIKAMFEWDFIKLIELNQIIANDAVGLCRDYGGSRRDSCRVGIGKTLLNFAKV